MQYTRGGLTAAASENWNAGPDLFRPWNSSLHDRELDDGKDETKTGSYEAVSCGPPKGGKSLNLSRRFDAPEFRCLEVGICLTVAPHSSCRRQDSNHTVVLATSCTVRLPKCRVDLSVL